LQDLQIVGSMIISTGRNLIFVVDLIRVSKKFKNLKISSIKFYFILFFQLMASSVLIAKTDADNVKFKATT
jgi:hypothetical protein